jgi:uncharacterized GH25 family protein
LPSGANGGGSAAFAKAVFVVGAARPGEKIWRSELGQRLEIVALSDPVVLARHGGLFEAQVLQDREPLAGVTVVAVVESAPEESYLQASTDTRGRVRFDFDRPGRWLVHLAHKRLEAGPEPGWILLQSSLTFDVGPRR